MNNKFDDPLTLEEKLAQLMHIRIGSNMPPAKTADEDAARVASILKECPIGGLLLFNGRWPATRSTLEQLQDISKIPLLVGSDIERGCGQQMHGLTLFPHAMAFGQAEAASEGKSLIEQFGSLTGQQARASGIHVTYAPVADANTNPQNPIIAIRAFSTDPTNTSKYVDSYIRGAETNGLATAAKHFPGHGDTEQDSHDSLPVLTRTVESIKATELPPFAAAINAGCSLVMTSHVAYPSLDPSGLPATLSYEIATRLLRQELGFAGVTCSDSLLMAGVRDRFESEGELCLATLNAGVDLLLDVENPVAAVEFLLAAVERGDLDPARIDEACARSMALKRKLFNSIDACSDIGKLDEDAAKLACSVARRAIRCTHGGASSKFDVDRPLTVVLLKPFETPLDPPEQPLAAALKDQFDEVNYLELGPSTNGEQVEQARKKALDSEQLLVAMIVKPAAWHKFGLLDFQQKLAEELATHPGVVFASLGVDGILDQFPAAAQRLCTFSDVAVSQQALAERLSGDSEGNIS